MKRKRIPNLIAAALVAALACTTKPIKHEKDTTMSRCGAASNCV